MNYGKIDVDINTIYINGTPHFFRNNKLETNNFIVDVIEEKTSYTEEYKSNTVIHTSEIKKFYDFVHILDKKIDYQIGARPKLTLKIAIVSKRGVSYESILKFRFEE
jgi:hypothetical protein